MPTDSSKRQDILDAALDLLVEHDMQSTAMSKVAKHAGTGMGTIYNYFPSKDDLLAALYAQTQTRLHHAIFDRYPHEADHRERFTHVWREMCRHFRAHPKDFLFSERYAASPYLDTAARSVGAERWALLDEAFVSGQEAGTIKPVPVEQVLPLIRGATSAAIRSGATGGPPLTDESIELVVDLLWDAIATR